MIDVPAEVPVRSFARSTDRMLPGLVRPGPNPAGWAMKVQRAWAERPVNERLEMLTSWRHRMVRQTDALTAAIGADPLRTAADVRVSEILPLLAACEFLEKEAKTLLRARSLGRMGRPIWLNGVSSEVQRVALGRVLIIGPSNYPLFLPGVQTLQALVCGNAVIWKPGRGGRAVAKLFAAALGEAGMPRDLLRLTEESVEAGEDAIAEGVDKVFFTGSAASGRAVMRQLAKTGTPSVMELSGCSSLVALPEADLGRVAAAVGFGMRLNGAATCMAPRRLLVIGTTLARRQAVVERLKQEFAAMQPVQLSKETRMQLAQLVEEAQRQGAVLHGEVASEDAMKQAPLLLVNVNPQMRIAQSDVFAPVLSIMDMADDAEVIAAELACPYALSVSIFGDEPAARRLAAQLITGTVVINDVIVPTADPRIPFGGRRASGFGVTRGAEGLLEMTAVKTILTRRGSSRRHYEITGAKHTMLFDGLMQAGHAETWSERWIGVRRMATAARSLRS